MNYGEKLKDSQGRAAEGLLATKIIDLMDKLRLGANEFSARRWIWELLQNAKDVAYDNDPVSVIVDLNIRLEGSSLDFKHNGQPFSSDNITSLIHQVSSKKRNSNTSVKKRPTGKFGTGFLSTHLLSEKVQVNGVVKEDQLPYKEFSIALDRSAIDPDEVLESVSNSLDAISVLLNSEDEIKDFDVNAFNTSFSYQLEKTKIPIAETGISDLHISLPYTLAFSNEIKKVIVSHEGITYSVAQRKELKKGIELVTILEDTGKGPLNDVRRVIVLTGQKAAIALEVVITEGIFYIQCFEQATPRLFCDFPLVGSESFPFPVIINSPNFNINEPRNGVWLTHKEDKRVVEDEGILDEAVSLFESLLIFAGENDWQNLFELAKTKTATNSDWLSKSWFDDTILKAVRELILYTPLIKTSVGKIPIYNQEDEPQIFFPDGVTNEIREQLWELSKHLYVLPSYTEVHQWSQVIWKNSLLITLPVLAKLIQSTINLEELKKTIGKDSNLVSWLNHFYKIMNLDLVFEAEILADKYSVIPNQSGNFLIKSELKLGSDVQDEIKDALELLGVPIRNSLVSSWVLTGPRVLYTIRSEQNIIDEINTLLTGAKISAEEKYAACDYLISLFPINDKTNVKRTKMYDFSKCLYPTTVPEKKYIKYNTDINKEADKIQLKTIVGTIAAEKNISDFTLTHDFSSEKEAIGFLHDFIQFLNDNEMDGQLNIVSKPILPNQHGIFKIKDAINLDDGEIPEQLKLVAEKLDYDVKDALLDKAIFLELPDARTVTSAALANEITSKVLSATTLHPRPENIKEAFRMLLLYFIEFPDSSNVLFSELFLHKHKLYDDEEIAINMKQAEDVKQLMEELNINSLEQMRNLLTKGISSSPKNDDEKQPITTEILASWGITTKEEYDLLMGTDVTSQIFKHYSTPTTIMFNISQQLIERAKNNIMAFLTDHTEYQTEFMELIAPTVLAGIYKGGISIHIVFRPGDNGEVLFYYPSEKATLDLDNAELWVDDGKNDPFHLTLGRILQTTGINRIPIYGVN